MVDIVMPRVFIGLEVAWVENLNSISTGNHADSLRRALGDGAVVANTANLGECYTRGVRCRYMADSEVKGTIGLPAF